MKHGLHYYDCKNRVDYSDECDKFKELDTCIQYKEPFKQKKKDAKEEKAKRKEMKSLDDLYAEYLKPEEKSKINFNLGIFGG